MGIIKGEGLAENAHAAGKCWRCARCGGVQNTTVHVFIRWDLRGPRDKMVVSSLCANDVGLATVCLTWPGSVNCTTKTGIGPNLAIGKSSSGDCTVRASGRVLVIIYLCIIFGHNVIIICYNFTR